MSEEADEALTGGGQGPGWRLCWRRRRGGVVEEDAEEAHSAATLTTQLNGHRSNRLHTLSPFLAFSAQTAHPQPSLA